MEFDSLLAQVSDFFSQYPYVLAIIAVILLYLAYRKPKESFKFIIFLLFLAAVFYGLSLLHETLTTGSKGADGMVNKSRKLIDE